MVKIHEDLVLSSEAVVRNAAPLLDEIREELDDHRLAINEGTQELVSTNECINALSTKLDRLAERVDELTLFVKGAKAEKKFDVRPLNGKEKDVFSALYELTETQPYASYDDIARKCTLPKGLVMTFVASMIQKGVPVLKKYHGSKAFLRLDAAFKQMQTKKNVVGVDTKLTRWF